MGKHVVIDSTGRPLPFTPEQTQDVVRRALERGKLLLVVMRTEADDLACHVLGPPSEELAEQLETLAMAYRKAITTPEHGGE